MPPVAVWLVRHGQSTSNAGLPATGHGDVPLTELGHEQARAVARRVDRQPDLLIVSPFLRARQTCAPIQQRWPKAPSETWDIFELTYLSPERCRGTTAATRKPMIDAYWQRCDPAYIDGPDAESFGSFMGRLRDFHERLVKLDGGFAVAVGHGQFFRAYMIGLTTGFDVSPDWMRRYRVTEVATPLANGEIVELSGEALVARTAA